MECRGKSMQTLNQSGRGRVKKFVANAKDALRTDSCHVVPAACAYDFCKRHTVARTAPRGHKNFWVEREDLLLADLLARLAQENSASRVRQLRDPALGCDHGLAPLLAEDAGVRQVFCARAYLF